MTKIVAEISISKKPLRRGSADGNPEIACIVCGCTWFAPCRPACAWVFPGLCSNCAPFVSQIQAAPHSHEVPLIERARKKLRASRAAR